MLTRFMLIASVLLAVYCVVLIALMYPWAWLAVGAAVLIPLCRRRGSWHAFGTARWSGIGDLRAQGMVGGGNGLIVGTTEYTIGPLAAAKALFDPSVPSRVACEQFLRRYQTPIRKLVRLNNAVHTAAFIPTGGGKGVSLVIPHLQTCPDSMIVLDYKGENARITAHARQKMKNKIVLLDPFKSVTQTPDTFNPLDFIDPDSPLVLDECRALANALVIRTGEEKDPHWNDSAEVWITAMIAVVVAFAEPKDRSLQAVRDLLTDTRKMEAAIQLMCSSKVWNGLLGRLGHQLTHFKDKELNGVLTTANRHLCFLDTPAIYESTKNTSSFDPAMLREGRMTIYLIIPPELMKSNTALLRMWIASLLRAVVRGGLQEKRLVRVILDEAASLCHMDVIDDAVDKYRGYGVRLLFLLQSYGQIKKLCPNGQETTFLSNVSQIYAGVNDNETAKYVSERLGKSTIVIQSGGTGTSNQTSSQQGQGGGSATHSSGSSSNDNWQQSGRELLQPSEVMNLDPRIAIVFTPGVPPIWTTLVRYYEAAFKKRAAWFWGAVGRFLQAVVILLFVGGCAALLTMAVNQKYQLVEIPAAIPTLWQPR